MGNALLKRAMELEEAILDNSTYDDTREKVNAMYDTLYPWQKEFISLTKNKWEGCLCAANQIGKTYLGTFMDSVHAMGIYPDEWDGHVFDNPPTIWCLGYSGVKVKDLIQEPLFGIRTNSFFTGGLIPQSKIVMGGWESMTGTPKAMHKVRVKHVNGISKVVFWSYSQGQHALMGDKVDWSHVDEEPKDQSIYPQLLTRGINGDNGKRGKIICTFTPENGRTELVVKFMENAGPTQFFMNKGWNDAPHLSEEKKEGLLASYPKHQRDMRSKGIPMLGHGLIYDFGEDSVICDPFDIPSHFRVMDGMDFGWNHPQARIRMVFNTETGQHWITHAWKQSEMTPDQARGATRSWALNCPTAWPADGLNSEKGSGEQQKKSYVDAGFKLLYGHACWPMVGEKKGGMSVEQGLYEIYNLISEGNLKVFSGCRVILDEMLQYHRDDKGKIVKANDDALDAMRYAFMMRRYAVSYGEIINPKKKRVIMPKPMPVMGIR